MKVESKALSDPSYKEGYTQLTTILFKPLSDR